MDWPSAVREPLHPGALKDLFADRTIQERVEYENDIANGFGHLGWPALTTEVAAVDNPGMAGRSSAEAAATLKA